jgi:hypothetical protein
MAPQRWRIDYDGGLGALLLKAKADVLSRRKLA